jgi:hypothetical protein
MSPVVLAAAFALSIFAGSAAANGPAWAPDQSQGRLSQDVAAANGATVAIMGDGVAVTQDDIAAYFEALEFVHGELGQPMRFGDQLRQQFVQTLQANFALLPLETQQTMAQARLLWTRYAQSWAALSLSEQQEFAYFVLAIAYGEQQAAQALGIRSGGGASGHGAGQSSSGGLDLDRPYEGSDCWASAGCSYDGGSGTYSYDSYD